MTLAVGNKVAKLGEDGQIIQNEGHRIFEVVEVESLPDGNNKVILKPIE